MNKECFDKLVNMRIEKCKSILEIKNKEYVSRDDVLEHFKTAGKIQDFNSRIALAGMMSKQMLSVIRLCKQDKIENLSLWDEKIGDTINYLMLLSALIRDEKEDWDISQEK